MPGRTLMPGRVPGRGGTLASATRPRLGAAALALVAAVGLPGSTAPAASRVADAADAAADAAHAVAPATASPTAPAGDPASYRLYRNPDGSPVRFDPCRPITVRVNAPSESALADTREALGRLAAATGLLFVLEGGTDFVPQRAQETLPGTDLVVAWAPPAGAPGGSDVLDDGQLGTGGWATAGTRYGDEVVWRATGAFAVLDATRDGDLEPGFGAGLSRGALLLHELSHALGVDHVDDPTQLMSPVLQPRSSPVAFGAGDLAALRAVGVPAGCLPG